MAEEITFARIRKNRLTNWKNHRSNPSSRIQETNQNTQLISEPKNAKQSRDCSKYYKPEELVGKKCVFLLNLQRRMLAGIESQCMVLAAEDEAGNVTVLQPEKDIAEGSKIG